MQTRNGAPVTDIRYSLQAVKNVVFDGGTVNGIGDHDGTSDPLALFTVTGPVLIEVTAYVKTTLVGAATIEVGIAGSTAAFLAQVANATSLAADEIWHDATPDAFLEASTVQVQQLLNNKNIIMTVGTANITAGEIMFVANWYPLSPDSTVVAA